MKQYHPGDDHVTVVLYTETHSRKIHARPLIPEELEDVHRQVRNKVSELTDPPAPQPKHAHDAPPTPPAPPAPERTDPVASKQPPAEVELTPKESEVHEYLLGITGKKPDPNLPKKAEKKFGTSVSNQWYALRKKRVIEKTPDGYLVHKPKVTVALRSAADPKPTKAARKQAAIPKTRSAAPTGDVEKRLKEALAFFRKQPDLLELVEKAAAHLAFCRTHRWNIVKRGSEIFLDPAD